MGIWAQNRRRHWLRVEAFFTLISSGVFVFFFFHLLCAILNVKVNQSDSVHIRFSKYLLSITKENTRVGTMKLKFIPMAWHDMVWHEMTCVWIVSMLHLILSSQMYQKKWRERKKKAIAFHNTFTISSESNIMLTSFFVRSLPFHPDSHDSLQNIGYE